MIESVGDQLKRLTEENARLKRALETIVLNDYQDNNRAIAKNALNDK